MIYPSHIKIRSLSVWKTRNMKGEDPFHSLFTNPNLDHTKRSSTFPGWTSSSHFLGLFPTGTLAIRTSHQSAANALILSHEEETFGKELRKNYNRHDENGAHSSKRENGATRICVSNPKACNPFFHFCDSEAINISRPVLNLQSRARVGKAQPRSYS